MRPPYNPILSRNRAMAMILAPRPRLTLLQRIRAFFAYDAKLTADYQPFGM